MCSWDIENALNKFAPLPLPRKPYISPKPEMNLNAKITEERLQKSYKIAASAVKEHGALYLEIFERMHNEIDSVETKQSLLDKAFKVANVKKN